MIVDYVLIKGGYKMIRFHFY